MREKEGGGGGGGVVIERESKLLQCSNDPCPNSPLPLQLVPLTFPFFFIIMIKIL